MNSNLCSATEQPSWRRVFRSWPAAMRRWKASLTGWWRMVVAAMWRTAWLKTCRGSWITWSSSSGVVKKENLWNLVSRNRYNFSWSKYRTVQLNLLGLRSVDLTDNWLSSQVNDGTGFLLQISCVSLLKVIELMNWYYLLKTQRSCVLCVLWKRTQRFAFFAYFYVFL